jgi:hypothetical protein
MLRMLIMAGASSCLSFVIYTTLSSIHARAVIVLELLQNFAPYRDPRLSDAMEKLFGDTASLSESCFMPKALTGNDRPQLD